MTLKKFRVCSDGRKAKKRARVEVGKLSQRQCGRCSEAGHNSCTYRQEAAMDSELNDLLQFFIIVCYGVILLYRVRF
jgi:hypothetical protein